MKKKILYMCQYESDATFYYRLSVLKYICNSDFDIERRSYDGNITWSTLQQYHVLILERPSGINDLQIIKLAKQVGVKVITDWDDDCLHLPDMNPMWHHYQQCKAILMECIVLSDELWVSTASLKKAYALYNKNIHVIPNTHNDYLFPIAQKKEFNRKTKKAFWRGGGSHEPDVYDVADKLITTINRSKEWMFHFIGCRFIYMEMKCGDNYQPVSQMPLMQYFGYMAKENPNIVFHPLQNHTFNESKSNIAWIESSFCGAAFFGNNTLPEFDKIGIMSFDNLEVALKTDYYYDKLELLNTKSWAYICENLLLSKINKLREERLLSL